MSATHIITYDDMPDEAWRRLERAADDPAHPMRLLVAATVDGQLKPAARTLVLRGASRLPPRLWFHTDARSCKVRQIQEHPGLCAVAYDHRDGVQLRIDGEVTVHVDDRVTDAHWAQVDLAIRYAYATSAPPGAPVTTTAEADPRTLMLRHRHDEGRAELGRAHFAVLEVNVATIEWFQSTTSQQCRAILRADSNWTPMPLTP